MRVAPRLPPGEGGGLVVTAPVSLCADATHDLRVVLLRPDGIIRSVLQGPAGPSSCRWELEGLSPGDYEAFIQTARDERIVATARRSEVVPGGFSFLDMESPTVEVEGVITLDGSPATDVRIHFRYNSGKYDWYAAVDENGFYRVTLDGRSSGSFCMYLERAVPHNEHSMACRLFDPGPQRFDADLHIPPGIIRIHVQPVEGAFKYDWAYVIVRYPGSTLSREFRPAEGFRGEYFAHGYRDYDVSVSRSMPFGFGNGDHVPTLTSAPVTLSVDHPVEDVELMVTPAQWSIPHAGQSVTRPPLPLNEGASNQVR
jgi:hypothetical protein